MDGTGERPSEQPQGDQPGDDAADQNEGLTEQEQVGAGDDKRLDDVPQPPATTIAALSEVMKIEIGRSPPWRERGLVSVSMGDLIAETLCKVQGASWFEMPAFGRSSP